MISDIVEAVLESADAAQMWRGVDSRREITLEFDGEMDVLAGACRQVDTSFPVSVEYELGAIHLTAVAIVIVVVEG